MMLLDAKQRHDRDDAALISVQPLTPVHFAFLDDGKFEVTAERSRVYLEPHATMSVAPQHGLH